MYTMTSTINTNPFFSPNIFSINIFNQYFQSIFSINIFNQYFQSIFSINIFNQYFYTNTIDAQAPLAWNRRRHNCCSIGRQESGHICTLSWPSAPSVKRFEQDCGNFRPSLIVAPLIRFTNGPPTPWRPPRTVYWPPKNNRRNRPPQRRRPQRPRRTTIKKNWIC